MKRHGIAEVTAAALRSQAKYHSGNTRDAFNMAADYVSCGRAIPSDVRAIIDQALSFTQDRYGH